MVLDRRHKERGALVRLGHGGHARRTRWPTPAQAVGGARAATRRPIERGGRVHGGDPPRARGDDAVNRGATTPAAPVVHPGRTATNRGGTVDSRTTPCTGPAPASHSEG